MALRNEPSDSLDFFPTPPWATRALCEWFNPWDNIKLMSCWEPACGEGDMVRPLREYFYTVIASDVYNYGYGDVDDFLFPTDHDAVSYSDDDHVAVDWIITNPPFNLASQFITTALPRARRGVAMLCRSVFLESARRHRELFSQQPPSHVLIFSERVPMRKGRLDPKVATATSHAWFVWQRKNRGADPRLVWIPPGTRKRLERDEDYEVGQ